MKPVDADKIKNKYPDRNSLNQVLNNAPVLSISEQIESIKCEICDNYCKIPFKYSSGAWEQIALSKDSPCNNCPLNRL